MQVLNNFTFKLVQKVPYSDEAISRIIDNRKTKGLFGNVVLITLFVFFENMCG